MGNNKLTDEELPEGYYFCPRCDRKTYHEYLKSFPGVLMCSTCIESEEG
jgi:hypothetical protein